MLQKTKEKFNTFATKGPLTILTIFNREGTSFDVKIDSEDFEKVYQNMTWSVKSGKGKPYISHLTRYGQYLQLSRLVNNTPDNLHCRFKNGDTFDCRKENLENCTFLEVSQHKANATDRQKSGIPYVFIDPRGYWVSKCWNYNTKTMEYCGTGPTMQEVVDKQQKYIKKHKKRLAHPSN